MNPFRRLIVCAGLALLATFALAAPPQTINYQGYLTGPTGTPTNTSVVMTFKLYNAASGGALLYTELQPSVAVSNGNFNALIGAVSPIPLPFDVPYWLTVTINADPEMSPRQPLASSAYAFRAATADSVASVNGSQITGSITTATIPGANVIGAIAGPTDITGNLTMVNSTSTTGNVMKGPSRFIHNFGSFNTFLGLDAGNFTMTGNENVGVGQSALIGNTTGSGNVAVGRSALANNTTGSNNTASGIGAMQSNLGGGGNTASGFYALASNTTGFANIAIGANALDSNTTGTGNIGIGQSAGSNRTTGDDNINIGNLGVAVESGTIRLGASVIHSRAFIAGIRSVTPAVNDALPVVIDSAGQLGTGIASVGTVTSVATGAGLSGGPITGTGTINLAATNLLPTSACTATQIAKWSGSAWACAADNSVPAGGAAGQILAGTGGTPAWTNSPTLSGSLNFGNTTRQMLNLYVGGGAQYALGVQDVTFYQRTTGHFAWYNGGTHTDIGLNPGAGGTTLMTLSGSALATPVVGLARAQTFSSTSDRNVKEAFAAVDGAKILAALVRMPMQSWKYRNEEKVRHIGPTAQDFRAAFGVGYDDKTIATVDADGVAMAAIQGLNQLVNEKDAEIKRQHSRIELLEQALAAIQSRLGMR